LTHTTRFRATLAYVGTDFHGWQAQANASRTVQSVLEKALRQFARAASRPVAAGRTDAGVHADGQVVHFDLPREEDPSRVRSAVNGLLPWDVRLLEVAPTSLDFHARRDAAWKDYRYRWSRAAVIPPRDSLFVSPIAAGADAGRMLAAAAGLAGERDFGVLGVRQPKGASSVRRLYRVEIEERGDEIRALFRGDAFLRGMVRSICGVLADVARGKAAVDRLEQLLRTGDRKLLAPKAQAKGLTLVRVAYGDELSAVSSLLSAGEEGRPADS
jgi:tRNA pseudouridine38-40 synthase